MTTGATGQLGLALPVQGELSGTWGDTVNNGITQYTNIAIAATLTLTGDGAVTLANTTGDASASNITSTLAGAGTVTAQFAIVRVSGTTVTKVITAPSYSKTYVVDNASSFAVTFKASGQTGVSVAAAEKVTVYFNGTDYIKIAGTIANAAGSNTQVQFNNSGLLGASASLTWDGTTLSSTQVNITGQGTLRLQDTTGGEYVGLRSPGTLGASYTLTFPADDGTSGQALITDGSGVLSWSTAASGDVYGPGSSTDNAVARFDSTTGKLLQNSVVLIGDTGAVTGVTDLAASGSVTLSGGTANGVTYLNGSKVLTSGSALTWNTTTFGVGGATVNTAGDNVDFDWLTLKSGVSAGNKKAIVWQDSGGTVLGRQYLTYTSPSASIVWGSLYNGAANNSDLMTLTPTGLGIGTSSPTASKLHISGDLTATYGIRLQSTFGTGREWGFFTANSTNNLVIRDITASADRLTIDSAGNVGIGTSSPTAKLDVRGQTFVDNVTASTAKNLSTWNVNGANYAQLYDIGTTANVLALGGSGVLTTVPSTPIMAWDLDNANVGIGTSSPTKKLEVANSDALIYGLTVGRGAGAVATNTAVGASALNANTSGANNTGIGYNALLLETAASNSTAIGSNTLITQNGGSRNVAVGSSVLVGLTTGSNNIAIGSDVAATFTTGSHNIAMGNQSFRTATGASTMNVAIGHNTLNGSGESSFNVAVGGRAMRLNTTGTLNTAVGSGSSTTTNGALGNNTTGSSNTAVGAEALLSNTTASNNTAVGYQAGYTGTTANNNAIFGSQAGYQITTGAGNCLIGNQAGNKLTTGSRNTLVGSTDNSTNYSAGYFITTGSNNTVLGCYSGNQGGLDIRTASNYIVLSDGDGNPRGIFDSSGDFLVGATSTLGSKFGVLTSATSGITSQQNTTGGYCYIANALTNAGTFYLFNFLAAGTGVGSITSNGTTTSYNVTSDERLKENIVDAPEFGSVIDSLQVRSFDWKTDQTHQRAGFIAQELVTVAPEAVHQPADTEEMMAVDYSKLVPMLVKEIQSLRKRLADAGIA